MGRLYRFFQLKMALKSFFAHLGVEKLGFRGGNCPKNGFFFLFFFFFPGLFIFHLMKKCAVRTLGADFFGRFLAFRGVFCGFICRKIEKMEFFRSKKCEK
jgi:hypothetical protein